MIFWYTIISAVSLQMQRIFLAKFEVVVLILAFAPFSFFTLWLPCLQLNTLRGSIIEDAVPSTSKHGLARGLPLKEVLEYLVPELNVHCLRLALNTPKVTEQLMKLDEQGVKRHNQCFSVFSSKLNS